MALARMEAGTIIGAGEQVQGVAGVTGQVPARLLMAMARDTALDMEADRVHHLGMEVEVEVEAVAVMVHLVSGVDMAAALAVVQVVEEMVLLVVVEVVGLEALVPHLEEAKVGGTRKTGKARRHLPKMKVMAKRQISFEENVCPCMHMNK
ncbi:hypothetical protein FCM35_KLT16204 [Carex littledalei]|uniref:Uncharacterized protein n=1 Tax=Carex littledalei TaxID=544730 RepID=A0A833RTC7_9POAL|nr:hypothetical protein FCM35_KLT16204 [Carex littledalei]